MPWEQWATGVNSMPFYKQLFLTKCFFEAFLYFQFGFIIFWHKNIGKKFVCKMSVKLITGVAPSTSRTPSSSLRATGS